MSLSSGEDEESRVRAESFGAVTLLDKAEFGHELIPAILRLGADGQRGGRVGNLRKIAPRGITGCGSI
jgi:hypothetical protein